MDSPLVQLIDRNAELDADNGFRAHLGGSLIGRKCERALWYTFRWATRTQHKGRMLRLFNRGHREEAQFVALLKRAGANVREFSEALWYHPDSDSYLKVAHNEESEAILTECENVTDQPTHVERAASPGFGGIKLKQWRVLDVMGHFGGSLDGIADHVPGQEQFVPVDEDILTEFKTHNSKSFLHLLENGLKTAKPEHFIQMQTYMKKKELRLGLYVAVNKNDDSLYTEFVQYDAAVADEALTKAHRIIHARQQPNRLSDKPSWFECKYCDHLQVCHFMAPMLKSCRTCKFVSPVEDGAWHCSKFGSVIPSDFVAKGCDNYSAITD